MLIKIVGIIAVAVAGTTAFFFVQRKQNTAH
jgi:hypothetical protein